MVARGQLELELRAVTKKISDLMRGVCASRRMLRLCQRQESVLRITEDLAKAEIELVDLRAERDRIRDEIENCDFRG